MNREDVVSNVSYQICHLYNLRPSEAKRITEEFLNMAENKKSIDDIVVEWAEANDYALVAKDVWRDAKRALEGQKTGKWIRHQDFCKPNDPFRYSLDFLWWCNKCNISFENGNQYKYCPNCGSRNIEWRQEGE